MNKILFTCLLIISVKLVSADDTVSRELVFKSDLAQNIKLNGWYDVHKWLPQNKKKNNPNPKWYKVVKENGKVFLRTSTMFGISSLLKSPIRIDDSVVEIDLQVKLRKPKKFWQLISIALTSRKCPAGTNGGAAFWSGRQDSGIIAQGYHHSIQNVNLIAWLKNGLRVHMYPVKPPFNLLTKTDKWITWRLVYNHTGKQLSFYRNNNEKTPFMIQRNVDLNGVVLNSVWISASGTEYSQIEVYCTKKQK